MRRAYSLSAVGRCLYFSFNECDRNTQNSELATAVAAAIGMALSSMGYVIYTHNKHFISQTTNFICLLKFNCMTL